MATVHYPETEFGDLHRRLFILRVGLLLVVALLSLRLWHLQILKGHIELVGKQPDWCCSNRHGPDL